MRKTVSIAISFLMLTGWILMVAGEDIGFENGAGLSSAARPITNALISHAPIKINSNADFDSSHGVTGGNGTQSNPYIIENYDINGTGYGYCVYIGNSTAYFVIRNCSLYNANGDDRTYAMNTGLYLYNVTNGILDNNTVSRNERGIVLYSSDSNGIINNTIKNNTKSGLWIDFSKNSDIHNNTFYNDGIFLYGAREDYNSQTITPDNVVNGKSIFYYKNSELNITVPPDAGQVIMANCTNITVEGQNISYTDIGIEIVYSSNITLLNNNIRNNTNNNIWVYGDSLNDYNNYIDTSNKVNGEPVYYYYMRDDLTLNNIYAGHITIAGCSNFNLSNISMNNSDGLFIRFSNNGSVCTFNISDSHAGIVTHHSSNVTIKDGKIWNMASNIGGIQLQWSSGVRMENIETWDCDSGILIGWNSYENSILKSYLHDNRYQGVYIFDSGNTTITNTVSIKNRNNGIYLYNSSGNLLERNNISKNTDYNGISMDGHCYNNWISNNILYKNNISGVYSWNSDNNRMVNNTIEENVYGIFLYFSNNDRIYHNNFINNSYQAYDNTGTNQWDNGYPDGGNYWSDYAGNDLYSGPNQDQSDSDGIGDTPYTAINGGSAAKDNYPLMRPITFSSSNDTTPPVIIITSPSQGGTVNTRNITVEWVGNDSDSGMNHYEVKIDNKIWINVGTNTSYTFTGLSDRNHTVSVKAVDNAGNENMTSVAFTTDTTSPSVYISSPFNGALFNTSSITVSWTGSDNTSGIDHYDVRLDGMLWIDVGITTHYYFTGLLDGNHTVDVKAVDNAGNEKTASVTFTTDTTSPSVYISSPFNGALFNTSSITVSWTGSDNTSGIDHYELRMDGGSWMYASSTSYYFTNLSDGTHIVYIKSADLAGNEVVVSVDFTIDTTDPYLSITYPSDEEIVRNSSFAVIWSGLDYTSGIDHYEVRIDGGSWMYAFSTSYYFTNLSDGFHVVDVRVVDRAGNENITSITFRVDTSSTGGSLGSTGGGMQWLYISIGLILLIISIVVIVIVTMWKRGRKQLQNGESTGTGSLPPEYASPYTENTKTSFYDGYAVTYPEYEEFHEENEEQFDEEDVPEF